MYKSFRHVAILLSVASSSLVMADGLPQQQPQIMIVGVAHFVSKHDAHNSNFDDMLSPERQKQIQDVLNHLAKFKPTKVMIEQASGRTEITDRYQQYLKGNYVLGANEIYQLGFRLAATANNPTIYLVDSPDDEKAFPFDYSGLLAAEKQYGQKYTAAAEEHWKPFLQRQDDLEQHGTVLDLLRYLNTREALEYNASWYMYADRIGTAQDYKAVETVSNWYGRNLDIFANIVHSMDSPDDRVVVIIGQGHAYQLRNYVQLSPDLQFVDPENYLK